MVPPICLWIEYARPFHCVDCNGTRKHIHYFCCCCYYYYYYYYY